MQNDAPSTTARAVHPAFSNAQPQQNLVVLSVVSFGLYPTYWLYRNLRLLRAHRNLSIKPAWRTFFAVGRQHGVFRRLDLLDGIGDVEVQQVARARSRSVCARLLKIVPP